MTDTQTVPRTRRTEPTPLRTRRPRWLMWVGILIIALGAIAGALLFRAGQSTQSVLAVRTPLVVGEQITSAQLAAVEVPANTKLSVIPASDLQQMVGKYATVPLPAKSLLTKDATATQMTPKSGRSIVGIGVKAAQAPTRGVAAGQPVKVVITTGAGAAPGQAGEDTKGGVGDFWPGTILAVGQPNNVGLTTIDVEVATTDAPQIAAAAGAGNVAIVVDAAN